jgi:hypothetical protein
MREQWTEWFLSCTVKLSALTPRLSSTSPVSGEAPNKPDMQETRSQKLEVLRQIRSLIIENI